MEDQKTEVLEQFQSQFGLNPEDMYKAGVHFGHRVSRLHPKMESYVFGIKNTVHIIDLEKTVQKLEEALSFLKEQSSAGKIILFAGTAPQHQETIRAVAKELGTPYVVNRWLGGTLTNFSTIRKRVDYLKELEAKRAGGELEKYTKKERYNFEKIARELNEKFEGLRNLSRLPDIVFVVDLKRDDLAVREARRKGIIIVGIADTNTDPTQADYPIPGNDDAVSSVQYILGKVTEAIKSGSHEKDIEQQ